MESGELEHGLKWDAAHWLMDAVSTMTVAQRTSAGAVDMVLAKWNETLDEKGDSTLTAHAIMTRVAWWSESERAPFLDRVDEALALVAHRGDLDDVVLKWPEAVAESRLCEVLQELVLSPPDTKAGPSVQASALRSISLLPAHARERLDGVDSAALLDSEHGVVRDAALALLLAEQQATKQPGKLKRSVAARLVALVGAGSPWALRVAVELLESSEDLEMSALVMLSLDQGLSTAEAGSTAFAVAAAEMLPHLQRKGVAVGDAAEAVARRLAGPSGPLACMQEVCWAVQRCGALAKPGLVRLVLEQLTGGEHGLEVPMAPGAFGYQRRSEIVEACSVAAVAALVEGCHEEDRPSVDELRAAFAAQAHSVAVSRALARGFPEVAAGSDAEVGALLRSGVARDAAVALEVLLLKPAGALAAFVAAPGNAEAVEAVSALANRAAPPRGAALESPLRGVLPLARRCVLNMETVRESDDVEALEKAGPLEDFIWDGVSLPVMRMLTYHPAYYKGMTTGDMLAVVKLETAHLNGGKGGALVELLQERSRQGCFSAVPWACPYQESDFSLWEQKQGRPVASSFSTEFVSHSWAYGFENIIRSLGLGSAANYDGFYWVRCHSNEETSFAQEIMGHVDLLLTFCTSMYPTVHNTTQHNTIQFDLFTVNQHSAPSRPATWWERQFRDAVGSFSTLTLVLNSWTKPVPMTRIWCIWEIFSAVDGEGFVQITFPPTVSTQIWREIEDDKAALVDMLDGIDVNKAQASFPADIQRILAAIDGAPGLSTDLVNHEVRAFLCSFLLPYAAYAGDESLVETFLAHGASGERSHSITLELFTKPSACAAVYAVEMKHAAIACAVIDSDDPAQGSEYMERLWGRIAPMALRETVVGAGDAGDDDGIAVHVLAHLVRRTGEDPEAVVDQHAGNRQDADAADKAALLQALTAAIAAAEPDVEVEVVADQVVVEQTATKTSTPSAAPKGKASKTKTKPKSKGCNIS